MAEMLQRCPEGCRNFIKAQLSEAGKKDGTRFDRNMKDLGLQLLHSSPKAYRQLKTIFALPSTRTLRRYVTGRVGYFSPGFLQGIISQMGVIATTMTPVERMCTVVLDEMAIKKQFDYDRRNDTIYGVSGSGAAAKQTMVQAVICDQGSPNVKAVRNLGASLDPLGGEESHCILVGVQRVPVIFDVPHLLKSIRNNLFKYGLQNLFSLIRGKGGHKYNPSAREFTAALRGLSVSNILPALSASAASNCEVDDGTTLLATVSEDAIPSTTTAPMTSLALPTSLTTEIEDEELVLMSDIVEDKTVGDCIEEEGLFYVAGWLVRVLQQEEIIQACPHCEVLLLGDRHQDHNYAASVDQPFLEAKKYTASANLMKKCFAAIQLLEGEFARHIDTFWPHNQITQKMERTLANLGVFNSLFSSHPEHASLLETIAIKKFVMCRLGAEIRERNRRLSKQQSAIAAQRKLSSFTA
ncbi:unnamed protein product [Leuciscus chuanchicus]